MTSHSSSITKKCKKACVSSSSSSSCCTEQCIDCCSSQFIRLNRFAVTTVEAFLYGLYPVVNLNDGTAVNQLVDVSWTPLQNRCGQVIPPPNTSLPYDVARDIVAVPIAGAYLESSSAPNVVSFVTNNNGASIGGFLRIQTPPNYLNTVAAYYFVNTVAYGPYEPGCHNDQVYGWYVNVENGQLQLFTEFENVPTGIVRSSLTNSTSGELSSTQKRQLKVLNKLFKLSKSAVKEIDGIPAQEGNIVEVCDCKGQRWLLYINTASFSTGSPLQICNYEFSIIATKLC